MRRGEARGRGGGREAAYLAEHPAELNLQLGLRVLVRAGGLVVRTTCPALVVRHGDPIRSHRRARKSRSAPAHSSFIFLLPKARELRTPPEQHRSASAMPPASHARPCQRPAGSKTRRLRLPSHRSSAARARGKSHNIEVAREGGAKVRPLAAHPTQRSATPAAAILCEAGARCHYLPSRPARRPTPSAGLVRAVVLPHVAVNAAAASREW